MKMYYFEVTDFAHKRATQTRCPIESPEQRTRKIMDPNTFQINRKSDWHGACSRPVNVRSKDVDLMSSRRQGLAKAVGSKDRPSVAHSRHVARDDMKHPHESTFIGPSRITGAGEIRQKYAGTPCGYAIAQLFTRNASRRETLNCLSSENGVR